MLIDGSPKSSQVAEYGWIRWIRKNTGASGVLTSISRSIASGVNEWLGTHGVSERFWL
jgi:hypothetical protein